VEKKKQHWIPQSYLQEWCDPDVPQGYNNYVWVFNADGKSSKKKDPKNIFYETDMYTIGLQDGLRDLTIEDGLCGLEGKFAEVRRTTIGNRLNLSIEERTIVLSMIAAFHSRTRARKEHYRGQWGEILRKMEEMKRFAEEASPEQRKALSSIGRLNSDSPSFSMEEVRKIVEEPLQSTLIPSVIAQTNLFTPMNLSFLCTNNDPGFITSDAPCVWFDPEAYRRPAFYRSPGLMYPSIEITLPISPKYMALISWSKLDSYIDVTDRIVDDLNRRTRCYADEHFIVKRNFTKEIWFDPGKPPEEEKLKGLPSVAASE
jgi:hypothetical protein